MANCGPLLVVEDNPSLREFLVALLEGAGYDVTAAETGEEALARLDGAGPAVALVDVQLPGTSGYVVCRELRARYGDRVGVIFLSGTRTESFDRVGGLLIGADDYLVKPFDPDELLARVARMSARVGPANGSRPRTALADADGLTRREREVLELLVDGLGQAEIAARLVLSPKTVATHIQRMLKKLGVHSRTEAVALVARGRAPV